MDDEDIIHWQKLIEEHKRFRRIREEQAASYGRLACPPHILLEIENTTKQIEELEQRIEEQIKNAGKGKFFNAQQVKEIAGQYAELAQMERSITLLEGMVQIFKESFYTQHQDRPTKFLIGVVGTGIVLRFVTAIVSIISAKSRDLRKKAIVSSWQTWIYVLLLYYAWRKLQELYSEVSDLDKMLQDRKEEFEAKKRELNKIFKVSE
jgi:hypothetical protein